MLNIEKRMSKNFDIRHHDEYRKTKVKQKKLTFDIMLNIDKRKKKKGTRNYNEYQKTKVKIILTFDYRISKNESQNNFDIRLYIEFRKMKVSKK